MHYLCVTSKNLWSKYGDYQLFFLSFFSSQNMANFLGISGKSGICESCLGSNLPQTDLNPSHPPPAPVQGKNPRRCDEIALALGRHGSMQCSATVVGRKLRLAK